MVPPTMWACRLAGIAVHPLLGPYLRKRLARGKEHPVRWPERFGHASQPRPEGPLVWCHAASVGESVAALPLIDGLLASNDRLQILLTTGTVTSAALLEDRLPERCRHQFVPVDSPFAVRRFLEHWRPDAALFLEQEWWPNLLDGLQRERIPTALVNARITDATVKAWSRSFGLGRHLVDLFTLAQPSAPEMRSRLQALGLPTEKIGPEANLKYAVRPPENPGRLATLQHAIGDRPAWCAFSVHLAEVEAVLEAQARIIAARPDALLLLAPRKPHEVPEIKEAMAARGLIAAPRSEGRLPSPDQTVHLADTMGEAAVLYQATPIAFVGGSLEPGPGGHNVLEAVACGAALLHGPHMQNFADIAARLTDSGGSIEICDGASLSEAVLRLFDEPPTRSRMAAAAETVRDAEESAVVARILAALDPILPAMRAL